MAVLNEDLSTDNTRVNDRFTMMVREPFQYRDAIIEGHVTHVDRGGRISGRSEMTLNFDRIRLPNGPSFNFAGVVQAVRSTNNDDIRVASEGAVQEDSRPDTTIQRMAIGTAIGALIGAIPEVVRELRLAPSWVQERVLVLFTSRVVTTSS